jgi:hypothetical protein
MVAQALFSIFEKKSSSGVLVSSPPPLKKRASSLEMLANAVSFSVRKNVAKKFEGTTVVELSELVRQATEGEVALCDISGHHQFLVLTLERKNAVLRQLAAATKCHAFVLHNLQLDDTNADALAEIISSNAQLGLLSVERNNLHEKALLRIAKAASKHANLRLLLCGEQKTPISTSACSALVEVMEETPSLRKVGVGTIRDDKLLARLEAATMANQERLRRLRREGVQQPADPPWVAAWERLTNAGKAALLSGNAPKQLAPKGPSNKMMERVSRVQVT